ncbi:MAG TPA: CNNM domain-containing protein [Verrucomicrobiae bacterium]
MNLMYLFLFIACVTVSFLLSGMEAGVLALSRLRVRQWVRQGNRRARLLNEFLERPENFLWTILVGNTLANIVVVCLMVAALHKHLAEYPWLIAVLLAVLFFAFYMFCDLLPKMLFRHFPNRLCLYLAGPFRLVHLVLSPLVWVIEKFANWVGQLAGGRVFTGQMFATRDEFRLVMQESAQGLTPEERSMIQRVLELHNLTVRQIMMPMEQAVTTAKDVVMSEVLELCREKRLTRLPVMETVGRTRKLAGVLSLKHVLYESTFDVRKKVAEYVQVPVVLEPEMRLEVALQRLQRSGQRMGVVMGRDQKPIGIVTVQDIMRVMFGAVNL